MSIKRYDVQWEDEDSGFDEKKQKNEEFAALISDEAPTSDSYARGELVTGVVSSTGAGDLLVDLGGKVSAVLLRESLEPDQIPELHQSISAYVVGFADGSIILSKTMSAKMKGSEALEEAYAAKLPVKGKVLKANKGGFEIGLQGKTAFCPISQIDSKFVNNTEEYVGKEFDFLITQYSPRNIVVSRQAFFRLKEKELIPELKQRLESDPFISGMVTELKDFGAMVDIGGVSGMIHISEVSYGRLNHPGELLKVGEKVRVKILKIEEGDRPRIALSIKQASTDPWTNVDERIKLQQSYSGKVTRLADFGAFVELEPGLEGLIHISEMSWTKRVHHPKELLSVGDRVEVRVTAIDKEKQRISLTLKDLEADPWKKASEQFAVGTKVTGKVQSLKSNGCFVELADGVVGFLPLSQLKAVYGEAYRKHSSPPKELEVEVRSLDAENRKLSLKLPGVEETDSAQADFEEYKASVSAKPESASQIGSFGELLKKATQKGS